MRLRESMTGSHAWVVAVLLALTPLAVDPLGLYPFGPLRWGLISSGVLLAFTCWLLQPELVVPRVAALVWVGVLAWGLVCTLTGLDPLHAFIGTPDRRFGWLTLALGAMAFLVGHGSARHSRRLVRAAILGLAGVGLYACGELLGWEPFPLTPESVRVGGAFGSAAYLAAYCVLVLPLAIVTVSDRQESGRWRLLGLIASLLGMVALVATQTRAGLVGLAAALLVLLPWLLRRPSRWWLLAGLAVLTVVIAATPAGQRLRTAFDAGAVPARLAEWRVGWRVLAAHPLVGVGPEGYRIAFPLAVDEPYEQTYGRRVIPDRAHNGAIDTGLALGLPGLAAYLVASAWLLVRAGLGALRSPALSAGLGAGVTGYLVQQQFLFPLAEVDPWFWALAGLLTALTAVPSAEIRTRGRPRLAAVTGMIALLLLGAGILEVRSDRLLLRAYQLDQAEAAARTAQQAASLRPDSIRVWLAVSDLESRSGDWEGAMTAIERALRLSPGDPALRATRVAHLTAAARVSGDPFQLQQALDAFADLLTTDPLNAQHHLAYGNALVLAGEFSRAEQEWQRAAELAPTSAVPDMNLARLYLELGRPDDAAAAYRRAAAIDPEAPGLEELARLLEEAGTPVVIP